MGYSQCKKPVGKSWQKAKQLRCIFTANSGSGSGCARDWSETVTPAQHCHTPPAAAPPSCPQAGLRLLWLPFLPSRRVALRRLASHRSLALIFPFVLAFKNALPCVPMRAFGWQPGESEREQERQRGSETVAWYLAPAWLGQMQKALNSMDTIDPEAAADAAAAAVAVAVAVLAAASNDVVVVVDGCCCCCCCSCHHCCCLPLSLLLSVFRLSHLNLLNYICYVGGNL